MHQELSYYIFINKFKKKRGPRVRARRSVLFHLYVCRGDRGFQRGTTFKLADLWRPRKLYRDRTQLSATYYRNGTRQKFTIINLYRYWQRVKNKKEKKRKGKKRRHNNLLFLTWKNMREEKKIPTPLFTESLSQLLSFMISSYP